MRLSQRRHSAQIYVVICGLVLHWAPARTRKTRPKTGLKVVVTLVRLWGPRGPPEGARRGPKAPGGPQNTTYSVDFQKTTKTWESWEREARLVWSAVRAIASIRMGVPEACARPERRRSLHELPLARA